MRKMGNKHMNALIGLIGTIVGAGIAGFFMFHREKQQRTFEKQKQKRDLLLKKYEEIFRDLSNYEIYGSEISMQMISEAGYGGKFDANKLSTSLRDNTLIMNATFYVPEIIPEITLIEEKLNIVTRAVTAFLLKVDAPLEQKSKFSEEALVASAELSRVAKAAKSKLAELAGKQVNA